VADQFWPEAELGRGRANLRVLVHRLRRELGDAGDAYLRYAGEVLELRPGARSDWLDAAAFAGAAREALAGHEAVACRAALALYGGEYLPGDAYAEWALGRREELGQTHLRLLLHLAALCRASEEVEEAEGCLRTILTLESCHEEAALMLMRLHATAGRPGQALRVYRRLVEALHEDLALEPEEETRALARALAAQLAAAPDVPVLATAPHNLPAPLTGFVGRRHALAELRALLRAEPVATVAEAGDEMAVSCRLLTLTGPGGVGKSRLALRLADELLDEPGAYPDGVWLVELASVADPALVPKAVAQTLAIQEEATRPMAETLAVQLARKRLLLLLDNCEHLLDGCALLVGALLASCPGLRVLATSRAALGVGGERPWPVPALSLPPAEGPAGRLLESEAVRLFLDRARMQRPELGVDEGNAGALARICQQVAGLPLALELAAARAGVLSLEQIAERLGEGLRLLTGGPRTAPARQRTLRATLDWSHELLGAGEQVLLRRLSVFAGGCALEAAEAVCAGEGAEVLDGLVGLVRHSLVQVEEGARYRLLETVRQYAHERLAVNGEVDVLGQRHAAYYLGVAEAAETELTGAKVAEWQARLEREHDNVRAALQWAWDHAEVEVGVRLVGALWRFWAHIGHLSEGRAWLERWLDRLGDDSPAPLAPARAKALHGAGFLAYDQGDYAQAEVYGTRCLTLRRGLGDTRGVAAVLTNLGEVARRRGDYARASALYEESLALERDCGDTNGVSIKLQNLGWIARTRGDYRRAAALLEESLRIKRGRGDSVGLAVALIDRAEVARATGDHVRAVRLSEESLALCRELGLRLFMADALTSLGTLATDRGDLSHAATLLEESLATHRVLGHKQGIAAALACLGRVARGHGDGAGATALYRESLALFAQMGEALAVVEGLEGLAAVAGAHGEPERAAQLWGAAAAQRTAIGAVLPPAECGAYGEAVATARRALGKDTFALAWEAGQKLSVEQAVVAALAEPP
jgi:predicted ATPase/DNA-binding SARP family transcriptional activator